MIRKVCASLVAIASALWLALGATACGDYPIASLQAGGGAAGSSPNGTAGTAGSGIIPGPPPPLPCEVLGNAGHECVSAHSTVRVIVKDYTGPLFQVDSGTGTLDIGSVDGYADSAAQDQFCAAGCTISIIYDQSGRGNHLAPAPKGSAKPTPANPANAGTLPVKINGRSAYGILFRPGQGYRAACIGCKYPEV